jgi:hypothetical protein
MRPKVGALVAARADHMHPFTVAEVHVRERYYVCRRLVLAGTGEVDPKQRYDDVPTGVVWIRDGWVGLNHLTSGDAVLTGDALGLFHFSVGQSDYGARVDVVGKHRFRSHGQTIAVQGRTQQRSLQLTPLGLAVSPLLARSSNHRAE